MARLRKRDDLRPYQMEAVYNAKASPQKAMLMEVGDGKTIVALTTLLDLGAWPALIVAPAMVAEMDVWGEEARAWEHTKNLEIVSLTGTPTRRELLLMLNANVHAHVISYENLRWLTSIGDISAHYAAIVFDELSKMKTPGSKRFRTMRHITPKIDVRLGLTGTPVGNHLLDLWGEMFMVGGPEPLGPTFTAFRQKWFEPIDYYERVWRLKCSYCCPPVCDHDIACRCHGEQRKKLRELIAPWVVSRPRNINTGAPEVIENSIKVPMPRELAVMSKELMNNLFTKLPSGTNLEALSTSAVAMKLRQLAGGAVYTDKKGTWEVVHNMKLQALDNMLDELQGEPALIYYEFKHEQSLIKHLLRRRGTVYGNGDVQSSLLAWKHRRLEVLLAHPASAGFGLNLQTGGHHVVWYTLPWSWERRKQGNGRIARPGQPSPHVTVTDLLCGPVDDMVSASLRRKGAVDDEVIYLE